MEALAASDEVRAASYVVKFKAHLVLEDAASKELRRSPQPGELSVSPTDRVVHFNYKRKQSGSHVRTLHEPRNFVNEREKECCLEALQLMGVRVVDVTPSRFLSCEMHTDDPTGAQGGLYDAGLAALEAAFAHPQRRRDVTSFVRSYSASEQLPRDVAAISRAFFGGSS